LFKLKCENLEEDNKYWVEEHRKKCIFCGKGKNNLKHYVEEYSEIRERFTKLGKDKEEILRKLCDEELDERGNNKEIMEREEGSEKNGVKRGQEGNV